MLVHQILKMKSDDGVVTVAPDWTLAQVVEVLAARRIGAVVVSADGKAVQGIISERDVVRELGRRGPACLSEPVQSVMTRKIVTCERSDQAVTVLERMSRGRFRHMPVVEGEEMVGLISIGDVVQARLEQLSMEQEALTGMIMGN